MFKLIITSLCLLVSTLGYSHEFMPKNDLDKLDDLRIKSEVTEDQFNAVIERAEALYKPIIEELGATLVINKLWSNSTVNASASQFGSTWIVNMYGGLARRPEVTEDGFAMVLCHELGHHVAGYPMVSSWAANEGQSDIFATSACAAKMFRKDTEISRKAVEDIPDSLRAKCDQRYQASDERDICYRSIVAGKSLGDLLAALRGSTVNYDTPDTNVVSSTSHSHPDAQCRLDTYIAGALCGAKWDDTLIPGKGANRNTYEAQVVAFEHSCPEGDGARPRCWFAALTPPEKK